MNISDMKKIAEGRVKGKEYAAEFIVMAGNNIDQLINVAEAAIEVLNTQGILGMVDDRKSLIRLANATFTLWSDKEYPVKVCDKCFRGAEWDDIMKARKKRPQSQRVEK